MFDYASLLIKKFDHVGLMMFNLFGVNQYTDPITFFKDDLFDSKLTDNLREAKSKGITELLVAINVDEGLEYEFGSKIILALHEVLETKVKDNLIENFVSIRNDSYENIYTENNFNVPNHTKIEWLLCTNVSKHKELNCNNFVWNPSSDKILFLATAKLLKKWRFLPFIKLFLDHSDVLKYTYIKQIVDEIIKSGYYDDDYLDSSNLSNLVAKFTNNRITSAQQVLDIIPPKNFPTETYDKNSNWRMINLTDYEDVCVEYSTETFWTPGDFLCEKTWRSICVGFPAFFSNPDTNNKLKSLGFKTYDHFVSQSPLPNLKDEYGNSNLEKHVSRCTQITIDKCVEFLKVANLNYKQVKYIIEHNKFHAQKLMEEESKKINNLLKTPLSKDTLHRIYCSTTDLCILPEFYFYNLDK